MVVATVVVVVRLATPVYAMTVRPSSLQRDNDIIAYFIYLFYYINFIGLPEGKVETRPGVPCEAPPN